MEQTKGKVKIMERVMKVRWQDIIQPASVNVIVGRKGTGKSCLGYYLADSLASRYSLCPVIAGFPVEKAHLLPESYVITANIEEALAMENSFILMDEGTLLVPAGHKLEDLMRSLLSLSRQRNQLAVLIFHSSRDIGSRILRGIDTVIVKEPSQRQISQGAKDSWWFELLTEAKRKFNTIKGDKRKFAYVDSEEPEFRGVLQNALPSFWNEEISKAWAGATVGISEQALEQAQHAQKKAQRAALIQYFHKYRKLP